VRDKNVNIIVSDSNISKPFLTNLPCLCPEKGDITVCCSLKARKLKWSVCQPVFIEQEMQLAEVLAVQPQ